jgi:hypothetical protein
MKISKIEETYSEKQTNITDAGGNKVNEITINIERTFKTKAAGVEYAGVRDKVRSLLKSRHFKGKRKEKEYMVALKFANGWYSGFWFKYPDVHLFSFQDYYPDIDDGFDDRVYGIRVYEKSVRIAAGGTAKRNDCLWKCLRYNTHIYVPWSVPWMMKQFLGVPRNAPVGIEHIPALEQRLKVNIVVSGDHLYHPPAKYADTIHLRLVNGHFTPNGSCNPDLIANASFREREVVIYGKDADGVAWLFDGQQTHSPLSDEMRAQLGASFRVRGGRRLKYLPLPQEAGKDAAQQWTEYQLTAVELKQSSFGRVNMLKNTPQVEALSVLHSLLQHVPVEALGQIEGSWIDNAYRGGITYARSGTYAHAHAYDFVSMYPSCMRGNAFPVSEGTYKVLEGKPGDHWPFGIYRCSITVDSPLMKNRGTHFTHYDLILAEELGGKIELAQDGEYNALLYPAATRKQNLFTKYVNDLFQLKQEGITGAKLVLNVLYGMLAKKNRKRFNSAFIDVREMPDEHIHSITPNDGEGYIVVLTKFQQPFKHPLARAVPFITANARLHMARLVRTQLDKVVRIQTDGCITTSPLNIPPKLLGTGLGQLKHEVADTGVVITHVNAIQWDNSLNENEIFI